MPVGDCDPSLSEPSLAYREWTDDVGATLQPFFSIREGYRLATSEMTDWLVLPAICLAIRVDADPVAVYPHGRDGAVWTVEDGLEDAGDWGVGEPVSSTHAIVN